MIKTIPATYQNGHIIPSEKVGDVSQYRIYMTMVSFKNNEGMTEEKVLKMVEKADLLFQHKKLREVKSLKELDI